MLLEKGTLEGVSKTIIKEVKYDQERQRHEEDREKTIYPIFIDILNSHGGSMKRSQLVEIVKNHPNPELKKYKYPSPFGTSILRWVGSEFEICGFYTK